MFGGLNAPKGEETQCAGNGSIGYPRHDLSNTDMIQTQMGMSMSNVTFSKFSEDSNSNILYHFLVSQLFIFYFFTQWIWSLLSLWKETLPWYMDNKMNCGWFLAEKMQRTRHLSCRGASVKSEQLSILTFWPQAGTSLNNSWFAQSITKSFSQIEDNGFVFTIVN